MGSSPPLGRFIPVVTRTVNHIINFESQHEFYSWKELYMISTTGGGASTAEAVRGPVKKAGLSATTG